MPNSSLGTIRGTIKIDYDGAGIVRAVSDTKKANKEFDKLDKPVTKILTGFGKFAKVGGIVAATALGIAGSIHIIAAALAIVVPLVGAGLAALPAVVLSVGAAFGVLKIATLGVGQALKDASKDAKTFNKDLKNLSPSARAFATDYRKVLQQLKPTQKAIQEAGFKGLGPLLLAAAKAIRTLGGDAFGVAQGFNGIAKAVLSFAGSSQFIASMHTILNGVHTVLDAIRPTITQILIGFTGLGAQGASFAKTLAGPLQHALLAFGNFLSTIDISKVFGNAAAVLRPLITAFETIGRIVGPIFNTLIGSGGQAAGILGSLATQLADFLESANGKNALASLGKAFQAISAGAGQVFLALLQQIGPILVNLAPGIVTLAGQITAALVPALQILGPLLQSTATFLSDNMSWLGPLAITLVSLAGAIKVLIALQIAWNAVTAIFATELTAIDILLTAAGWTIFIGILIGIAALVVLLVKHFGAIVGALQTALMWFLKFSGIELLFQGLVALPGLITKAWAAVSSFFANLWNIIVGGVVAGFNAFIGFFVALPGRVLAALAAFPGMLGHALKVALDAMLFAIGFAIGLAIREFLAFPFQVIAALKFLFVTLPVMFAHMMAAVGVAIGHGFMAALHAFTSFVSSAAHTISTLASRVAGAVASFVTSFPSRIRAGFSAAKSAVTSGISAMVGFFKALPGKIGGALASAGTAVKNAFKGAGSWLYQAGKDVIMGLVHGIGAAAGAAVKAAKHVADQILGGVKAALHINSPSKKFMEVGNSVIEGFVKGIQDQAKKPVIAFNGVIHPMMATVPRAVSTAVTAASTARPAPPAHVAGGQMMGPYHLVLDKGVIASFVIDTITGQPRVVAKAHLEGTRQLAWAGSGRGR